MNTDTPQSGAGKDTASPIVLVSGAWHGAWCWLLLHQELARRSISSVAVEPLGFGGLTGTSPTAYRTRPFDAAAFAVERSAVAELTLEQVRDRLVEDVRLAGHGQPVMILAHSISGFVVSAAIESAPHLFESIVYLAAITPLLNLPAAAYNVEPEMRSSTLIEGLVGDPATVGAARCDFDGNPTWAADTFYADAPKRYRDRAIAMLTTDVPFGINGTVTPTADGLGSVRHSYIHTEADRAVPLAMQQRIVREIEQACGSVDVRSMDTSHSPFLSQPGALADHLVDLRTALQKENE